ncbi:MAG: 3-deoxy-8-phosphooctulonate synthase [Candidatus Omnitrophica bacterium]|nr:3-deoxy-8-phosphooctulonate synthase [Candidatus Omnitrophota bacterium]
MAKKNKFIFIAGPCVIESKNQILEIAAALKELLDGYPYRFIFKASFDKANRTSIDSFRGPGLKKGVAILEEVKKKYSLELLSDIHIPEQAAAVKDVLDIIQIPAFLCRQTDLLVAAAKTKKTVNIKKAQFLSAEDMKYPIEKVAACGNKNIILTERGTAFGYNNLVVDFRSFLIMREFGYPVIFDVTHSLQRPSGCAGISGGDSQFVPAMARAGVALGIDGLFMEVHQNPRKALSDKHTVFALKKLKTLLDDLVCLQRAV